jgi:hypothetical protein
VAAISPLWLVAHERALDEQALDRDLLDILARRYGWEIVPTVRLRPGSERGLEAWLPGVVRRAEKEGWAGLRLDAAGLPGAVRARLVSLAAARRLARPRAGRLLVDGLAPPPAPTVADGSVTLPMAEERR